MKSQHDLGGKLDEIDLQNLGHEREASGSAKVTLDDLDGVLSGEELDVERSGDAERAGNRAGDLLDPADGLHVKLLRRELDRGVPGMDTGIFNVLRDGVGKDLTIVGHRVELYLLAAGVEFADHDRMLLGDFRRQAEEVTELLLVVADIHSGSGKHVRRSNQHREANLPDEIVHLVDGRELAPFRLVNPEVVHNAGELVTVLGLIDVLGGCTENRNVVLVKLEGEIVRDLAAHGDNDSVRGLKVDDVHHPLEGELVEIEPVAHVVVGGDRLRVVVDQHSPVALLLDGLETGHGTPVEFHGRTDPVGSRTEDNHRLAVTLIFNVTLRAVVGQVEVVRLCREFGGEGVYLLDERDDAV